MDNITFQPYVTGITDETGKRIGSIDPRLSRTDYFDGQLLKASDLTRDQIYVDERLLEMGQVLGSGIAQGLEVWLEDNHHLKVQPGIAIAASGRVLQLGKELSINLQDSGVIADLNRGRYRRFNRGLYAVAVKYAEVVDGVAERYPADLASRRQWAVSSYAEGVELALIPLNLDLPRGDGLAIRATLAPRLIAGGFVLPTDEAVALGLLAIDQARPLWLDLGLLRRPLRRPQTANAVQWDLASHYRELFEEVRTARRQGGRGDDFVASQYFRLLPPFGPLPKGSVDPATGRQSYFPKDYDVAIAPVRQADLPALIEESSRLSPMDLERDADADIMVLVPMSDQAFALRARQLEKSAQKLNPPINKLPWFNSLALRLFTQPPVHLVDTDADAWAAIWKDVDTDDLIYVRRPPRTAETNVSAVVLARGFELPPVLADLPPDPASLEEQLEDAIDEANEAKAKITQLQTEATALKAQIEQLQKALGDNTQLNEALEKIQKLEQELAAAEAEIDSLKAAAQESDTLKTALTAATDKIKSLTAELELAYKKIAELQTNVPVPDEAAQQKIKELSAALKEATDKATTLQEQRDKAQVQLAECGQKIKTLNIELEELKKKLEEAGSGSNTREAELAAAKEEILKLKGQADAAAKERQTLQTTLDKNQELLAKAQDEAKTATLKLADALKLAQDAQTENNTRAAELARSKELIAGLEAQRKESDQKIADLQLQLTQRVPLKTALPLGELATTRGTSVTVGDRLEAQIGDNNEARLAVARILMLADPRVDKALWPSLATVAKTPKNLPVLSESLAKAAAQGTPIAKAFPAICKDLGVELTATELQAWATVAG